MTSRSRAATTAAATMVAPMTRIHRHDSPTRRSRPNDLEPPDAPSGAVAGAGGGRPRPPHPDHEPESAGGTTSTARSPAAITAAETDPRSAPAIAP